MEKEQSTVTNKIRTAIKEKLSEISDFVDDELPEYIMILVANQRSKAQIEKDLSLFLRNDSVIFTNWLWQLLSNLKVNSEGSQSTQVKNESATLKKKDPETDEDAVVLDCDPDEHEGDFLSHEDTNDSVQSSVLPATSANFGEAKKETSLKTEQNCKLVEKKQSQLHEKLNDRTLKTSQNRSSKEPLASAVVTMKNRNVNSDDEYDPAKPDLANNSRNVSYRKYSGPAALQANKLLQKAVDDATKSILVGKSIEDYYKPTPIKVLTSKRYGNVSYKKDDSLHSKRNSQCERPLRKPQVNINEPDISNLNDTEYSDILMEDSFTNNSVSPARNRTICLKTLPFLSNIELESRPYSPDSAFHCSHFPVEEVRPKSPHFIVTLEGVNPSSLKRKLDDSSIDSIEEDEEESMLVDDDVISNTSPEKKVKLNERCKYWPACKNSDQCPYHHPTIPCKSFPECKFGDKCLYIHPNCKFDALCSRKDCPYTHASKRKLPLVPVPIRMIPVKSRKLKTVCKFYPKCTSKNCQFIHPKLCRYGTDCRLPMCVYSHFSVPSRSQLKWQASVT